MESIEKIASAMNDKTRILIVAFLAEHGTSCVCELEESLGLFQSRISRHLKILKEGGFVVDSREGKWVHYTLTCKDPIQKAFLITIKKNAPVLPVKIERNKDV